MSNTRNVSITAIVASMVISALATLAVLALINALISACR
jgi:hypothetical protein